MDKLLPGITAERVPTSRLTTNVLSVPGRSGPAVLGPHLDQPERFGAELRDHLADG